MSRPFLRAREHCRSALVLLLLATAVANVSAEEISQEERAQLKALWHVEPDVRPYAWSVNRHIKGYGPLRQRMAFKHSYSITNLPAALRDKEVTSALKLRIVEGSFNTLHLTYFERFERLLRMDPRKTKISGPLKTDFSFSNAAGEPAFYTQVQPGVGKLELDSHRDAFLKLRFRDVRNVFTLELRDPGSDAKRRRILTKLTGQKDFWDQYVAALKDYPFDLFMNAVVKALRQYQQIPVDLMLYSYGSKDHGDVPRKAKEETSIYLWPIIYDRGLLAKGRVEQAYSPIFVDREQLDSRRSFNGQKKARPLPMTRAFYKLMLRRPPEVERNLVVAMKFLSSTTYEKDWNAAHPGEPFDESRFNVQKFRNFFQKHAIAPISAALKQGGFNTEQRNSLEKKLALQFYANELRKPPTTQQRPRAALASTRPSSRSR